MHRIYASPCRDVTTNSSPLNSLPEAIIRLDEDGSEVIGSECRGLDTNHDTTAYLTRIQVSKDISSWIVGLFFLLSPRFCLQKIANRC